MIILQCSKSEKEMKYIYRYRSNIFLQKKYKANLTTITLLI